MTKLTKPVRRDVGLLHRDPIVLTLYPAGVLGFRRKRSAQEYTLPLETAYRIAIELELEARRRTRAAARKARA